MFFFVWILVLPSQPTLRLFLSKYVHSSMLLGVLAHTIIHHIHYLLSSSNFKFDYYFQRSVEFQHSTLTLMLYNLFEINHYCAITSLAQNKLLSMICWFNCHIVVHFMIYFYCRFVFCMYFK